MKSKLMLFILFSGFAVIFMALPSYQSGILNEDGSFKLTLASMIKVQELGAKGFGVFQWFIDAIEDVGDFFQRLIDFFKDTFGGWGNVTSITGGGGTGATLR